MRPTHSVRLHNAFRRAGGPRRVDDVEGVERSHRHRLGPCSIGRQPCIERHALCRHCGIVDPDAAAPCTRVRWHQVFGRSVHKQDASLSVTQHGCRTLRRARWRNRCHHQPRAQRPQKNHAIAHRVERADGDHLTGPQTIALKRCGDPVHRPVELRVGQRLPLVRQRGMLGLSKRVVVNPLGNGTKAGIQSRHAGVHLSNHPSINPTWHPRSPPWISRPACRADSFRGIARGCSSSE